MAGKAARQRLLSRVAERGMAQVMAEGDGLRQILVQAERPGDGAGDLGDLQRVRRAACGSGRLPPPGTPASCATGGETTSYEGSCRGRAGSRFSGYRARSERAAALALVGERRARATAASMLALLLVLAMHDGAWPPPSNPPVRPGLRPASPPSVSSKNASHALHAGSGNSSNSIRGHHLPIRLCGRSGTNRFSRASPPSSARRNRGDRAGSSSSTPRRGQPVPGLPESR